MAEHAETPPVSYSSRRGEAPTLRGAHIVQLTCVVKRGSRRVEIVVSTSTDKVSELAGVAADTISVMRGNIPGRVQELLI